MPIKQIRTDSIGQSGDVPKIVYISSDDTFATVTATGYLNPLVRQKYNIRESDVVLITTKTSPSSTAVQVSWLEVSKSGNNWTLVALTSPSTVASVTGTGNRITVTGTTNAVIDIAATYIGQSSITTVGTISSGVWNGTGVSVSYGGTGANSFNAYSVVVGGASTTSPLQSVASTGSLGQVLTSQGAGALPQWTTIAGSGDMVLAGVQTVTGAKTFNTNTFILAGSGSGTITVNAPAVAGTNTITFPASTGTVALTSDIPTTPISLANGGTNAALVASNGGIFYSTATAGAILAGTATAGRILRSGSSAAPSWSTATYPATAANAGRVLRADGTNWVQSTSSFSDTYGANQLLFAGAANTVSGLATANNGVLITSGAGVPSISSTLPAAVQGNITTVGTVTSGTWNADTITVPYGGTGNTTFTAYSVILGGTTATGAFQNVAGVGTSGQVLTSTGAGSAPTWQSPAAGTINSGNQNELAYYAAAGTAISGLTTGNNGTLITSAGGVPSISSTLPAAVQGNITATGTVATGTWEATDVALAHGGTNASLTADNGAIVYSDATKFALLASTATAGKVLQSGSSAAPTWSTPTYPSASGAAGKIIRANGTNNVYSTATFADTYAASDLLYSNGANAVVGLTKVNNSSLSSDASGVPTWLALTDGEIVIGSAAGAPAAATITAGTGISVVNGNNSITISTSAAGTTWNNIAGTSQTAAVNNGYVIGNASQTTVTLPATAALGSVVEVVGKGAGGWILSAAAGDTIQIGGDATSAGGSLTSAGANDSVRVVCVTADTTWNVVSVFSAGLTIA